MYFYKKKIVKLKEEDYLLTNFKCRKGKFYKNGKIQFRSVPKKETLFIILSKCILI